MEEKIKKIEEDIEKIKRYIEVVESEEGNLKTFNEVIEMITKYKKDELSNADTNDSSEN